MELISKEFKIKDGDIVIGAITSCTNTSNPSVMIGAGLVAKKAVEKGLKGKTMGKNIFGTRISSRNRLFRKSWIK